MAVGIGVRCVLRVFSVPASLNAVENLDLGACHHPLRSLAYLDIQLGVLYHSDDNDVQQKIRVYEARLGLYDNDVDTVCVYSVPILVPRSSQYGACVRDDGCAVGIFGN